MTIVCGTDFTSGASQAADAAGAIAAALGDSVDLVHVANGFWRELSERTQGLVLDEVRSRLRAEAERVRQRGVRVEELVLHGVADEALVAHAEGTRARLIVVSSTGRRAPARWLLGSVAERTAQTSPVPVLVVRDAAPFEAWAARKRPLRVVVGADLSASADAAIAWVGELRAARPCDVVVAYSSWPPGEQRRMGGGRGRTVFERDPEIDAALWRDLERKVSGLPGEGEVRVRVETSLGQAAAHLVTMAIEEQADLLVVGTSQRRGAARLWQGSVSRGVLHGAPMSVACVPERQPTRPEVRPIPEIRTVLAATDFSPTGDRAIPYAYAMLPAGGTVHLVHVVEMAQLDDLAYQRHEGGAPAEAAEADEPELSAALQALAPADAGARKIETRVHVVRARGAGAGIAMTAERLGVDAICIGSHGRSGLTAAVLGSVAQEVVARSARPVLVVGPRS